MSARGLYVTGSGPATGKSAVALAVHEQMARRFPRVGVFRPVVAGDPDPILELLAARGAFEAVAGVTYEAVRADPERALPEIVTAFRALVARCDRVVAVGTDFADVGAAHELDLNATLAVNLGLPVLTVVSGYRRSAEEVDSAVAIAGSAMRDAGVTTLAVVVNRATGAPQPKAGELPVYVVPDLPLLEAPTVAELVEACEGELIAGDAGRLEREAGGIMVAAMTLPNLLDRLEPGVVVVAPGDRADVVLGALLTDTVSGVLLTGGLRPAPQIMELIERLPNVPPVALTEHGTYETATTASGVLGRITPRTQRKIDAALAHAERFVDAEALAERLGATETTVVTPLMFEHELLDRARARRRHIVLPEGTEERILRAAEALLRREVAELTLLGDPDEIRAGAARHGLDIEGAHLLDPFDEALRERFAAEYVARRSHRGATMDNARDRVADVNYFGTFMVELGLVDGMVSGAVHTTAQTIRPAFELIRAAPGRAVVSSVFFMCLSDRVLVYGDCAVNPEPTAEQLADIAVSSAATAAQFGVAPRVAMLSYSTGSSGSGADVDRVREATALARERAPELAIEGPIQYDAAVDAGVAATKLPGSEVAGRATVFVFPDLNTGNNTYKAVQRSAGAVAIGPVLQGLNKPVNDLSRGALVQDIVNTVAITAIQSP